jgi:hypothetical protein
VYFLLQITCLNLDYFLEKNLLSSISYSKEECNYINLLAILVKQLINALIVIGQEIKQDHELDILLKIQGFLKEYMRGIIEKICDYSAEQALKQELDLSESVCSVVYLVCFWMEEEGIELQDLPEFKTVVEKLNRICGL